MLNLPDEIRSSHTFDRLTIGDVLIARYTCPLTDDEAARLSRRASEAIDVGNDVARDERGVSWPVLELLELDEVLERDELLLLLVDDGVEG